MLGAQRPNFYEPSWTIPNWLSNVGGWATHLKKKSCVNYVIFPQVGVKIQKQNMFNHHLF